MTDTSGAQQTSTLIERADLLLASWNGVTAKIRDLYAARSQVVGDRDITVIAVSNDDNLERMLQQKEAPLELPVIGVTPVNVDPNDGSYNRVVMRKDGIAASRDADSGTWTVLKVAPYILTVSITMLTDDVVTAWRMIDRWLANERWLFELRYPGYSVKVKCAPDKSIGFPKPSPNAGNSDQYRIQTNLKVETYAGYIWRVPEVRKIDLSLGLLLKSPPTAGRNLPVKFADFVNDPANAHVVLTEVLVLNPNGDGEE